MREWSDDDAKKMGFLASRLLGCSGDELLRDDWDAPSLVAPIDHVKLGRVLKGMHPRIYAKCKSLEDAVCRCCGDAAVEFVREYGGVNR